MIKFDLLKDELLSLQTVSGLLGFAIEQEIYEAPDSTWHKKDQEWVRVDWSSMPGPSDVSLVDQMVINHDPANLSSVEIARQHKDDVNLRFAAANLSGKTPQQIYTAMQNKMDGWTNLAQAKADLREWLPLMAAGIVWLVKNGD